MSDRSSGKNVVAKSGAVAAVAEGKPGLTPEDRDRLARLVRTIEGEIVPRLLVHEDVRSADTAARSHLGLIAPAARRLSEPGERDECDFDRLLAALGRLESVILELNRDAKDSGG